MRPGPGYRLAPRLISAAPGVRLLDTLPGATPARRRRVQLKSIWCRNLRIYTNPSLLLDPTQTSRDTAHTSSHRQTNKLGSESVCGLSVPPALRHTSLVATRPPSSTNPVLVVYPTDRLPCMLPYETSRARATRLRRAFPPDSRMRLLMLPAEHHPSRV